MFDTARLAALLEQVEPLWSAPSDFAVVKAHHGYRQITVAAGGVVTIPDLAWLLEPFAPVADAWLSRIDPGGFVIEHVDSGPYRERWQVPCTAAGILFHGDDPVAHQVGVPFQVVHHDWHSVRNDDTTPRVSVVIDRAVPLHIPNAPFRTRGGRPA